REHLLITQARNRYVYGTLTTQMPSQFLQELPENIVRFDDVKQWRTSNLQSYFMSWISGIATPKSTAQQISPAKTTKSFDWDENPFSNSTSTNSSSQRVHKQSAWKK